MEIKSKYGEVPKPPKQENSTADWLDISHENYREYWFGNNSNVYRIENPCWLLVSPTHSHRVVDALGVSHYIRDTFKTINWAVKDEQAFLPENPKK